MNFLGLIKFFEKVPKPLISTLLSRATASVIVSKIASTAFDTSVLDKSLNSLLIDDSISDRKRIFFLFYSLNLIEIFLFQHLQQTQYTLKLDLSYIQLKLSWDLLHQICQTNELVHQFHPPIQQICQSQ